VYGLEPARLWATIFEDDEGILPRDDEAAEYWRTETGINPEHILPFGRKDNFWMMADTGPCGPNSEINYDRGPEFCDKQHRPGHVCQINGDCQRFVEIWNLVFIQFNSLGEGILEPLPAKHVDTGLGFERLVAILQKKPSNYRTDLFWPIIQAVQELSGHTDKEREEHIVAYRVIADHIRSVTCLIGDGVLPANDGQGYVLRMILRRAVRFGRTLGFTEPFMANLANLVIHSLGDTFPELPTRTDFIKATIMREEKRFLRTIDQGLSRLETVMQEITETGNKVIPGEQVFYLHDTLGLPFEVTRDIAAENNLGVDEAGYREAREEQRTRGRASGNFTMEEDTHALLYPQLQEWIHTQSPDLILIHDPYTSMTRETEVVGLLVMDTIGKTAKAGDQVEVVLKNTPFYVESGGQVSDTGSIANLDWEVIVHDTISPITGFVIHLGEVTRGQLTVGDHAIAQVDSERRWDIQRNHTATHLLHRALREVVGSHVQQGGSIVSPDRLRFDFNNDAPLTLEQRAVIERLVSAAIMANYPVSARQEDYRDALSQGVIALFEEKYGDVVRVLRIGDADKPYSQELCGGTHVNRTGDIGPFVILSESGIGAGIRRLEAVTGRGAFTALHEMRYQLEKTAQLLDGPVEEVTERVRRLQDDLRNDRRKIEQLNRELAKVNFQSLLDDVVHVKGIPVLAAVVEASDANTLREMADWFRDKMQGGVIVLGSVINEKPLLIAATTREMVKEHGIHAGNLVRDLAKVVGGGGGGRPDIAQAGGRDAEKLPEAIESVVDLVTAMVA
jgi:alanyl-tRNA synthetase